MGWISNLLTFSINSTLLTAFAALSLHSGVAYVHGKFDASMTIFIGCSTWGLYLFHRLYKVKMGAITDSRLRYWLVTNFSLLISLLFALLLCSLISIYYIQLSGVQSAYLIIFSVIVSWYVVPIGGKALRTIPYIKSLVVALTWSLHLFYFPLYVEESIQSNWLELASWVLFFYAVTIPFDSRDCENDEATMNTLPQLVGKKTAGTIAQLLLVIFGFLSVKIYANIQFNYFFWIVLMLFILVIKEFNHSQRREAYAIFDLLMLLLGMSFFIN